MNRHLLAHDLVEVQRGRALEQRHQHEATLGLLEHGEPLVGRDLGPGAVDDGVGVSASHLESIQGLRPTGQPDDGLQRVGGGQVHDGVGSQRPCHVETPLGGVHHDHAAVAGGAEHLETAEADDAGAQHDHRFAAARSCQVDPMDRGRQGLQRGALLEAHPRRQVMRTALGELDRDVLREAAQAHARDPVTGAELPDARPHRGNLAGQLVAHDATSLHRPTERLEHPEPVEMQVRAADAARGDAHQDFVGGDGRQREFLHTDVARSVVHGSLHGRPRSGRAGRALRTCATFARRTCSAAAAGPCLRTWGT